MPKYNIEGDINFYNELYKSLDESNDDLQNDENQCKITGMPLTEHHVVLECGHKFNYVPLYDEIYKQKYHFKTYLITDLNSSLQKKFKEFNTDYYIRCPYCRDIQKTLLPYVPELREKLVYGLNSDDTSLPDKQTAIYVPVPYVYKYKGYTFVSTNEHQCCYIYGIGSITYPEGIQCTSTKLTLFDAAKHKYYCASHITQAINAKKEELKKQREELKKQKQEEKQKQIEMKLLTQEQKKKEREAEKAKKLAEKEKKLEKDRKAKRQSVIANIALKVYSNTKKQEQEQTQTQTQTKPAIPESLEQLVCPAILKSGPNKGKKCGCAKQKGSNFCGRHSPKIHIEDKNIENTA
jgi:hypothetical protein